MCILPCYTTLSSTVTTLLDYIPLPLLYDDKGGHVVMMEWKNELPTHVIMDGIETLSERTGGDGGSTMVCSCREDRSMVVQ